jgi:hypothetical protein
MAKNTLPKINSIQKAQYIFSVYSKKQQGFVVLFTVLIAGIILALGLGIFSIAYKELQLTFSAKESQYSFFAADAGADCALFYDLKKGNFSIASPATPQCNGSLVANFTTISPTSFSFQFNSGDKGCAIVFIDKAYSSGAQTRIISKGYNTTCNAISTFDTNRITERLLEVKYANPTGGSSGTGGSSD